MPDLSTAEGDVLEAIRRLEAEAREFREHGDAAAREEDHRVLELKAGTMEETAKYLRAHLS